VRSEQLWALVASLAREAGVACAGKQFTQRIPGAPCDLSSVHRVGVPRTMLCVHGNIAIRTAMQNTFTLLLIHNFGRSVNEHANITLRLGAPAARYQQPDFNGP
jgi:hypothetical protein